MPLCLYFFISFRLFFFFFIRGVICGILGSVIIPFNDFIKRFDDDVSSNLMKNLSSYMIRIPRKTIKLRPYYSSL